MSQQHETICAPSRSESSPPIRLHPVFEVILECNRVVAAHIAGREDQGHRSLAEFPAKVFDQLRMQVELTEVASLERVPFGAVMLEPPAQLRARCYLPDPAIEMQPGLRQAAKPNTVDQDASAIARGSRLVGPL